MGGAALANPVPFSFAQTYGVLVQEGSSPLCIWYRPGLTVQVMAELRRALAVPLQFAPLAVDEFQQRLSAAYQSRDGEALQVAADLGAGLDLSQLAEAIPASGDLMDGADDAPVIRLINALLSQAVRERASDIHFETFEECLSVRFRLDGMLTEVLSPPRALAPLLVSRLKVMARLDIAERRVPQDGRMSIRLAGHAVDIRVSTMPAAHGERVVLRLLDKQAGQLQLPQLHMPTTVLAGFERALATAHGIVLVTGPTGSGKTTTLYAGLAHINDARRNILTIEDPIEYLLPGIGQTQVNPRVEMTFARGLRAILRQDPDVVMVGEIRDSETAQIAVQASLTGHLVLSTLHTNTAVGAIARLQDMGVETFLLASSLRAVLAQRLVRLLCVECRQARAPTAAEMQLLGPAGDGEPRLHRHVGCPACHHTGYRGRTGIYELVIVDEALRAMIHAGAAEQALAQLARLSSTGIREEGWRRVWSGDTTIEEVLRVTAA